MTFTLTLVNPCRTATLTASLAVSSQTVKVMQAIQTVTIPSFTLSISPASFCGSQTYSVSPLDPMFTYDSIAKTISMYTNDETKVALSPYMISISNCLNLYPTICITQSFSVAI